MLLLMGSPLHGLDTQRGRILLQLLQSLWLCQGRLVTAGFIVYTRPLIPLLEAHIVPYHCFIATQAPWVCVHLSSKRMITFLAGVLHSAGWPSSWPSPGREPRQSWEQGVRSQHISDLPASYLFFPSSLFFFPHIIGKHLNMCLPGGLSY